MKASLEKPLTVFALLLTGYILFLFRPGWEVTMLGQGVMAYSLNVPGKGLRCSIVSCYDDKDVETYTVMQEKDDAMSEEYDRFEQYCLPYTENDMIPYAVKLKIRKKYGLAE